jgi:hypothetical protein
MITAEMVSGWMRKCGFYRARRTREERVSYRNRSSKTPSLQTGVNTSLVTMKRIDFGASSEKERGDGRSGMP